MRDVVVIAVLSEIGLRACFLARNRYLADDPGRFELYALGGSTTAGQPYDTPTVADRRISVPLLVERMFGGRIGGRRIEVRNLAVHGHSIYPQDFFLEREIRYRRKEIPGVVFIYCGENDDFFDDSAPTPWWERQRQRLGRSVVLGEGLFHAERLGVLPGVRTLGTYEHYLRRAIEASIEGGLQPVLATMIGNVADIDPGLRADDPGVDAAIGIAERLEERGDWGAAVEEYRRAAREHPANGAYMSFRIGKCLQRLGRFEDAHQAFWTAIDTAPAGVYFRRAHRAQNDLVRALAREYGVVLVDVAQLFEAEAPHGLVGGERMIDGIHPDMAGYVLIARQLALAVSQLSGEAIRHPIHDDQEAFRVFMNGPAEQVDALLKAAAWLVLVSEGHPRPAFRLQLAERRYREAVALDPNRFSAWLGLAVVEAAHPRLTLATPGEVEWLRSMRAYGDFTFEVSDDDLEPLVARLREWGATAATLEQVVRTHHASSSHPR